MVLAPYLVSSIEGVLLGYSETKSKMSEAPAVLSWESWVFPPSRGVPRTIVEEIPATVSAVGLFCLDGISVGRAGFFGKGEGGVHWYCFSGPFWGT